MQYKNYSARSRFPKFLALLSACYFLQMTALAQAPNLLNYQGRLLNGTNLVNATVGLTLSLHSASAGGSLLYRDSNQVIVVDGLYNTFLGDGTLSGNLDDAMEYPEVWLEATINGTTLTPRERLAAVPYALRVSSLQVSNNNVVVNPAANNKIIGFNLYSTISGGQNHGINNSASYSVVAGGHSNQIGPVSQYSFIGGGHNNTIASNSRYNVISGGYGHRISNLSWRAVIAGGSDHDIGVWTDYATIGGGDGNRIRSFSTNSTISGGGGNIIFTNSSHAVISGGWLNRAQADYAVVPGGQQNYAIGANSFAAGRRAKAEHEGAFVWGDSQNTDVLSTANDQVTFRAAGGFRVLDGALEAQDGLSVGGGTMISLIQSGVAILGTGVNVSVYSVTFPIAFPSSPVVTVTPRNDPSFNVNDTFVATLRTVTATNFTVNIVRVDSPAGWAQNLRLHWKAWD